MPRQQPQQQPSSLEQYVAMRYMQDLNTIGYQPVCKESEELIYESLQVMATLNKVTQGIRQRLTHGRASA